MPPEVKASFFSLRCGKPSITAAKPNADWSVSVVAPLVPVPKLLHTTEADRPEQTQLIHPTCETRQDQTDTVKEQITNINNSDESPGSYGK